MSKKKDRELFWRLVRQTLPYKGIFAIAVLFMLIGGATDPVIASLLRPLMDGAFMNRNLDTVRWMPLWFILLFSLRAVSAYLTDISMAWVSQRVIMDLRNQMFRHLLRLPCRFLDRASVGSLLSRFTYDVMQIRDAAMMVVITIVRDGVTVLGLLGWMCYLDWKLFLIAFTSTPFVITIIRVLRKRLRRANQRLISSMVDINQVVAEGVSGYRVIKAYRAEAFESARFAEVAEATRRSNMRLASLSALAGPVMQIISSFVLAAVVFVATRHAVAAGLSVGSVTSFCAALAMISAPLKRLMNVNEALQRALASCEGIYQLLDETPEEKSAHAKSLPEPFSGKITLTRVRFCYPGNTEPAIDDISLVIMPAETVAIVGGSGSGKTSLTALLVRFYSPQSGAVYLDDVNIEDISLSQLREQIAFVSQDIVLFNDTVRRNIAFGELSDATDEAVRVAAEKAQALDFIVKLPRGFDTIVGERGINLSGGQRQRIAIARALLKRTPILVFDEATSSLDSETEAKVQAALAALRGQFTCIIIAHRLSTIQNADRIVVFEAGKIAEIGSHQQLLDKQSVYARLYRHGFTESPKHQDILQNTRTRSDNNPAS